MHEPGHPFTDGPTNGIAAYADGSPSTSVTDADTSPVVLVALELTGGRAWTEHVRGSAEDAWRWLCRRSMEGDVVSARVGGVAAEVLRPLSLYGVLDAGQVM